MARLPEGSFGERAELVAEIAAAGDPRAAAVLEALGAGELHRRKEDGAIVRVTGRGSRAVGFDPLTGAELGPAAARSTEAVRVNNALRRAVRSALSTLHADASRPRPAHGRGGRGVQEPRPRRHRGARRRAGRRRPTHGSGR